jgi:hypothetical protein
MAPMARKSRTNWTLASTATSTKVYLRIFFSIISKQPRLLIDFTDDPATSKLGDVRNYGKGGNSGNASGPHHHDIANKLDPRVNSDQDNRARHEAMAISS